MKKIFKRRGQASIEFALILPIFALVLFALIYLGFLFIDVVTLDSAAAAAARNAAQNNGVLTNFKPNRPQLFLYWYEVADWPPKEVPFTAEEISEQDIDTTHFIRYGVQAELKDSVKDNAVLKMILPEKYTVVKTAYKESGTSNAGGGSGTDPSGD